MWLYCSGTLRYELQLRGPTCGFRWATEGALEIPSHVGSCRFTSSHGTLNKPRRQLPGAWHRLDFRWRQRGTSRDIKTNWFTLRPGPQRSGRSNGCPIATWTTSSVIFESQASKPRTRVRDNWCVARTPCVGHGLTSRGNSWKIPPSLRVSVRLTDISCLVVDFCLEITFGPDRSECTSWCICIGSKHWPATATDTLLVFLEVTTYALCSIRFFSISMPTGEARLVPSQKRPNQMWTIWVIRRLEFIRLTSMFAFFDSHHDTTLMHDWRAQHLAQSHAAILTVHSTSTERLKKLLWQVFSQTFFPSFLPLLSGGKSLMFDPCLYISFLKQFQSRIGCFFRLKVRRGASVSILTHQKSVLWLSMNTQGQAKPDIESGLWRRSMQLLRHKVFSTKKVSFFAAKQLHAGPWTQPNRIVCPTVVFCLCVFLNSLCRATLNQIGQHRAEPRQQLLYSKLEPKYCKTSFLKTFTQVKVNSFMEGRPSRATQHRLPNDILTSHNLLYRTKPRQQILVLQVMVYTFSQHVFEDLRTLEKTRHLWKFRTWTVTFFKNCRTEANGPSRATPGWFGLSLWGQDPLTFVCVFFFSKLFLVLTHFVQCGWAPCF